MPDDYLEHLDGLGIETTITAAELCAIGTWERVGGGYRVLDWEAVEVCLDRVRQDNGEDPRALAWDREHEARIQARMARPMVVTPPCAACGTPAAHIELLAPGQLLAGWDSWHGSFLRRPEPGQWYLLRQDLATGTSYGGPVDASFAGRIAWALRPPLRLAQVRTARFHDDAAGAGTIPPARMKLAVCQAARISSLAPADRRWRRRSGSASGSGGVRAVAAARAARRAALTAW